MNLQTFTITSKHTTTAIKSGRTRSLIRIMRKKKIPINYKTIDNFSFKLINFKLTRVWVYHLNRNKIYY